jgi:hypothetical protein
MFAKVGKKDEAKEARAQADMALQTMISLETQQGAYSACVIPDVSYYPDYEYGDWIVSKI